MVKDIPIERAVKILNGHKHRDRSDWFFDKSTGEVCIEKHETFPIHPIDARIIAAFYWHGVEEMEANAD